MSRITDSIFMFFHTMLWLMTILLALALFFTNIIVYRIKYSIINTNSHTVVPILT